MSKKETEIIEGIRITNGLLTTQRNKKVTAVTSLYNTLIHRVSKNVTTGVIKLFEDITTMSLELEGIQEIMSNLSAANGYATIIASKQSKVPPELQTAINNIASYVDLDVQGHFKKGAGKVLSFMKPNAKITASHPVQVYFKRAKTEVEDVQTRFPEIIEKTSMPQPYFLQVLAGSNVYKGFALTTHFSPYQFNAYQQGPQYPPNDIITQTPINEPTPQPFHPTPLYPPPQYPSVHNIDIPPQPVANPPPGIDPFLFESVRPT